MLSRPVAGIACKIRLSIRNYQAVALVTEADRHTVRLFHRDPGLSVDIAQIETLAEAEDCRDHFADMLGLPPLTMGRGSPAKDDARRSDADTAPARRANRAVRARRARFLTRRANGGVGPIRHLPAQEIIARS